MQLIKQSLRPFTVALMMMGGVLAFSAPAVAQDGSGYGEGTQQDRSTGNYGQDGDTGGAGSYGRDDGAGGYGQSGSGAQTGDGSDESGDSEDDDADDESSGW